jgi:hypothetical protein
VALDAEADTSDEDLELRLVDPLKRRSRVYGLTECRTRFGEVCLRIARGRKARARSISLTRRLVELHPLALAVRAWQRGHVHG